MTTRIAFVLSVFAVPTGITSAAVTYVDAIEGASGNTFTTGSTLDNTSWFTVDNPIAANQTQ